MKLISVIFLLFAVLYISSLEIALSAQKSWEYALWIDQGSKQIVQFPDTTLMANSRAEMFDQMPGSYAKSEAAQSFSNVINKFGSTGWEMVGCFDSSAGEKCYFKREVNLSNK